MHTDVPVGIPKSWRAGDTVKWDDTFDDFTSTDSWVLTYYFWLPELTSGKNRFDDTSTTRATVEKSVQASTQGSGWRVALTASDTVDAAGSSCWTPGRWQYHARMSKSGEVYTVAQGEVDVLPNANASTWGSTYDPRNKFRYIVEKIDQAVATKTANGIVQSYTIDNRNLAYMSVDDLLKLRGKYNALAIAEERRIKGQSARPEVYVRFGGVA